jgi:hypothetical protein
MKFSELPHAALFWLDGKQMIKLSDREACHVPGEWFGHKKFELDPETVVRVEA